jgi:hypothetical protein
MPIDTTKDLLYVVLAFCVLWLTVFLSWGLYYLIAILRDAESVTSQARRIAQKAEEVADSLQEGIGRSLSFLGPVAGIVKDAVVQKVGEKLSKRRAASKRRSKADDDED